VTAVQVWWAPASLVDHIRPDCPLLSKQLRRRGRPVKTSKHTCRQSGHMPHCRHCWPLAERFDALREGKIL
jgi:hypothetical protein